MQASNNINEENYAGKPTLNWIDPYERKDGTEVKGHSRTSPNKYIADNLGTDIDYDGIPGYIDADADGDGINESLDINNNGISDTIDIDGDGVVDLIETDLISFDEQYLT